MVLAAQTRGCCLNGFRPSDKKKARHAGPIINPDAQAVDPCAWPGFDR
jgi:hypothetical protein